MTTNVYDLAAGLIASDSRWSYRITDGFNATTAVVYSDDTGFEKIEDDGIYAFVFAGNSKLIDDWKQWIRSPQKTVLPHPGVIDDFAICMIDLATKAVRFEHGQKIGDSDYRFAGTGAFPAYTCWSKNKDAKLAVTSAQSDDVFSGGDVKFFEVNDHTHNLNKGGLFSAINSAILNKGMVMYLSAAKPVTIQEAASNDPRIKELVNKIAGGNVSAEAPSGLDKIVWTQGDIKRLDDALADCYGIPKK